MFRNPQDQINDHGVCLWILIPYWCELKTKIYWKRGFLKRILYHYQIYMIHESGNCGFPRKKKGLVINPLLAQDLHNHTTNETYSVRLCSSSIPSHHLKKQQNNTNGNIFHLDKIIPIFYHDNDSQVPLNIVILLSFFYGVICLMALVSNVVSNKQYLARLE